MGPEGELAAFVRLPFPAWPRSAALFALVGALCGVLGFLLDAGFVPVARIQAHSFLLFQFISTTASVIGLAWWSGNLRARFVVTGLLVAWAATVAASYLTMLVAVTMMPEPCFHDSAGLVCP